VCSRLYRWKSHMATKNGPHLFGIGSHLDAVRSTRRQKIFAFGHCWVVLAVLLPVQFPYPCTFRPSSRIQRCSSSESGPFSSAARFSRSSRTSFGPVSTTSTCGLVRQNR
jgi:hypothetical protein